MRDNGAGNCRSPWFGGFPHLPEGGRFVHEEHDAISLPKGWYRVIRQREYVPAEIRYRCDLSSPMRCLTGAF
jgi:hypothetical protein